MIIQVNKLTKSYNPTSKALDDVSVEVAKGSLVGLIGENGAGKSTLFHILMGFLPYDDGEVEVFGQPVQGRSQALKKKIGFVPSETSLLPWATTYQIGELYSHLYPAWDESLLTRLIDEWQINPGKRVCTMSRGQKRLAELALCFSCRPEILLVDEPFNGLDVVMRMKVCGIVKEINRETHTTVFYSSHILSEIEQIATRIIILRHGKVVADDHIADLTKSIEETFVEHYGLNV